MICDNCGANIDKSEEYCPNCGMELLHSAPKHTKKKYYKNSEPVSRDNPHLIEKPIKKRYYEDSRPESPDYSQYDDDGAKYEESETLEEDHKEKSGSGIGNIILLLFIALILGFIVGMMMFSSSMQYIPGFSN
jgi:predicted  nucleic acid-binding Zn-ribbon protein